MAKHSGVSLPSGQGGLVAGASTTYHSKVQFSPKFVVVFSLAAVAFILVLFKVVA